MLRRILLWLARRRILRTIDPSPLAGLSRTERMHALALIEANPGRRLTP